MSERRRLVWETYGDLGIARSREVTTPEKVLAEIGVKPILWCEAHQQSIEAPGHPCLGWSPWGKCVEVKAWLIVKEATE